MNIKYYVVWHDDFYKGSAENKKHLEYINLSQLKLEPRYQTNQLAENRLWYANFKDYLKPTDYVGFFSGRFDSKYSQHMVGSKAQLDTLMEYSDMRENKVLAPYVTDKFAFQFKASLSAFPGMEKMIKDVIHRFKIKPDFTKDAFICNSFICHTRVFIDFIHHWRLWNDYIIDTYGMEMPFKPVEFKGREFGLVGEVLAYLYFASRFDITIDRLESNTYHSFLSPRPHVKQSSVIFGNIINTNSIQQFITQNYNESDLYWISPSAYPFTTNNGNAVYSFNESIFQKGLKCIIPYIRTETFELVNGLTQTVMHTEKAQKLVSLNKPVEYILDECFISTKSSIKHFTY